MKRKDVMVQEINQLVEEDLERMNVQIINNKKRKTLRMWEKESNVRQNNEIKLGKDSEVNHEQLEKGRKIMAKDRSKKMKDSLESEK